MGAFYVSLTSFFVGVLLGFSLLLLVDKHYISIPKTEWNCTQSRIIDPKNVDKTECIVYVRSDAK